MKRVFLLLFISLTWKIGLAQYKPVDQGSMVQFTIQNFGFDVNGSFKGLHGTIDFDSNRPESAHFDIYLDANTINTDNNMRDNHLRDENYFNIKKYPEIHLESIKVQADNKPGVYLLLGKLTIKNTAKNIFIPFSAKSIADGYQFAGSFKINRKDFSVGGTSTISDELQVSLNIIAKK